MLQDQGSQILAFPVLKALLTQDWTLKIIQGPSESKALQANTYNVSLPTYLHLDLMKAGAIQNIYQEDNHLRSKWISQCTVSYSTIFKIESSVIKQYQRHQLVFEGIDTFATVYLNGEAILQTENAFRLYRTDIKQKIKIGENHLEVIIVPTTKNDEEGQVENRMPFAYAHTRKACYQYSWDWAPYANTLGIWKSVYLQHFGDIKIQNIWATSDNITNQKAIINFSCEFECIEKIQFDKYELQIKLEDKILLAQKIREKKQTFKIDILQPRLWWPNGIGEPFIYDFCLNITCNNSKIDSRKIPFGIRTIKLDETDRQFRIVVNGFPVYCRGANYVPPDMFYPALSNKDHKSGYSIESLLNDAVESNFNMLRIWGGGQYESDEFLQSTSRKGLMIFYDFMFSDSIYPSTELFLYNVQEEVRQQIKRARNYPSLALWCGNNQILQGIMDWGWGSAKYKADYHQLFQVLIPSIVNEENPRTSYIPSSPNRGVGNHGFQRGGNVHFWGVWAGQADFEVYRTAIGAFNSQFGTQALPVWKTVCQMVKNEKDRSYSSPILLAHQRHNSKFNTLRHYMTKYMKPSYSFEMETYQSGLLQAFAIQIAIKAQRISKPKSFGTLYWQFNDAWPAISWSSIDYFGRWKPLQYMAKRMFTDIAIFSQSGRIYVINDKKNDKKLEAIIEVMDYQGKIILSEKKQFLLLQNEVKNISSLQIQQLKKQNHNKIIIYCQIFEEKQSLSRNIEFVEGFKEIQLPKGKIQVMINQEKSQITLNAGTVIKNLFIHSDLEDLKLSDNYFDLVPHHPVTVKITKKTKNGNISNWIKFKTYRQTYTKQDFYPHFV